MKRLLTAFVAILLALPSFARQYDWHEGKYSMFIHFGLYSELGGVWEGRNVTRGYSEQIQSHAGIYSDVYAEVADRFDPVGFDADGIVALAQRAGMHSIVLTSKHHDGFCLFKTSTTDFNSADATPSHRDYVGELAQACHKAGMHFGLYFSIIDWHEPHGAPITSHNADAVTPEHHAFNLQQVEEIVTHYGEISELWFDMGSNTPEQSRELYDLVKKYQPGCMVSGRLGNGYYDFAVMSDNYYPEASLQVAWQSCASMFDETWGYRSWQQRGDVHAKAREKLRSLLRVVAGGGNFLLNIGPDGRGEVVPFEREVLEEMGAWLAANSDAVYATDASPFRTPFAWGCITRKGNVLNLILSGEAPEDGRITLGLPGYRLVAADGPAKVSMKAGVISIIPSADAYEGDIKVLRLTMDKSVEPVSSVLPGERYANCSYHCHDYYTNYRSAVSYEWQLSQRRLQAVDLTYTSQECGRRVVLEIDSRPYEIVLADDGVQPLETSSARQLSCELSHSFKSTFDDVSVLPEGWGSRLDWRACESSVTLEGRPFETWYMRSSIESDCDQTVLLEVGAGNGLEVYVNGVSVARHLNPYRCVYRPELVLVDLKQGGNTVIVRDYNRFEKQTACKIAVSEQQKTYHMTVVLDAPLRRGDHRIVLRPAEVESRHQDCELHNVRLSFR